MKTINEFLGLGKTRLSKILDVLEVNHWDKLNSDGQAAITTLIEAIDYIEDNYEKFSKYDNTETAVRDAINNALEDCGYEKVLKF